LVFFGGLFFGFGGIAPVFNFSDDGTVRAAQHCGGVNALFDQTRFGFLPALCGKSAIKQPKMGAD